MSDPDIVKQLTYSKTAVGIFHYWVDVMAQSMKKKGISWYRISVSTIVINGRRTGLIEGWLVRPADEGPPRFDYSKKGREHGYDGP